MSFLFFSFRQNIAHLFKKRKKENFVVALPGAAESIFCLKFKENEIAASDFQWSMKTDADAQFNLISAGGERILLKSDHEGYLNIKNLHSGEYTLETKK